MRLLTWALATFLSSSPLFGGTTALHEALSPAEVARLEASLTPRQTALITAITSSLAEDPSVDMWWPAWDSLCTSLGSSLPRSLVARHVVEEALRLSVESLAAANSRVGDIRELQDKVRREQGRVVKAADRFVTKEYPETYHQSPRFVPDRSLAKLAPSASNPQLARMDQLQDYMAELGAAADTLVDMLSDAERTAGLAQRDRDDLGRRLPEISRKLAACEGGDPRDNPTGNP